MDDGNAEVSDKLSDNVLSSNPESSSHYQGSTSINIATIDLPKSTRTCTHTHTCNPPGPVAAHTHTCYHTHTQVIASNDDDIKHTNSKPGRPSGNREAVRKYREKKKARTAFLEEEVEKLRLSNRELVRKLQGKAVLEAELSRLRSILSCLKGKIDNELGVFPFLKERTTSLHCQNNFPCFQPHDRN
ncbi:hypothetical protein TanjilG_31188 [Lupinus angustifolius]|uniref:BZIP domain-containing protein n=1 Tax=Lupinus angustifolius TaxID=3871 RepID=A0A1J7HZH6_LUPAN|nr:PREDICTED: basic leucine zipper 23 [Lupinus angustifolius]OIW11786.1 hypothetical protein TanjilG_31188 [Lupinus angustifolius]